MIKNKGFTLIELMIISALLGILSAFIVKLVQSKTQPVEYRYSYKKPDGTIAECSRFYSCFGSNTLSGCRDGKSYYDITNVEAK